ncbi:hypothetical protein L208DRAFT_1401365 [Tricholoma matsutake]|nr:hypothetical protein L208DRAFT_1401365 [Tricholoma matsutake 945]
MAEIGSCQKTCSPNFLQHHIMSNVHEGSSGSSMQGSTCLDLTHYSFDYPILYSIIHC